MTTVTKQFVAPALPLASEIFDTVYFNKFNSILRLYFSQLDNLLLQLVNSASTYKVTAFTASTTITVVHNFGIYPVVNVINSAGVVITPAAITHNSVNDFTVILSIATTGNVIAVAGKQ